MQKRLLFPLATFCATTLVMALQKPILLHNNPYGAPLYGLAARCRVV